MTPSKKPLKPFMAYIEESQHTQMMRYAKKANIPMSQLVREAIALRIAPTNPYRSGFNDGIDKAMTLVNANKASQMRFPSGKSFAELINEDLESAKMSEQHENTEG
ncbi:ribbon-helix-helix domain-containing protein [bacterium]|nr:ribbon-helix-helix domain-containing protein [bacterium]